MKDHYAIKKLHILKRIQPSQSTLSEIKEGVYYQIKPKQKVPAHLNAQEGFSPLLKFPGVSLYIGALVCVLFLFVSVFVFLPNQTHDLLLSGRLAIAPNQYEKARIAFSDTTTRFPAAISDFSGFSESLAITNAELNRLKLKGEQGKYTAAQCHEIYQQYSVFLEQKEKDVAANPSLASQVHLYEEVAEHKLHLYSSM